MTCACAWAEGRPWEVAQSSWRARGRTPKLSINHAQGSLSLSIIIS